jgi:transcriptional regulator with XRE-family HTH domain
LLGLLSEKGLTQREFAKAVGITEPSATKYCRNGGVPEWDILLRIAKYFSVSVDWLLEGDEPARVANGGMRARSVIMPAWLTERVSVLSELDPKGQAAVDVLLNALSANKTALETKPPPRKAAAGSARARRK